MTAGWVKVFRKMTDWEHYKDGPILRVMLHLILTARSTATTYKGVRIPAGSVLTSYPKLAAETGLTIKQVRSAIGALKRSGEVAVKRAGSGTSKGTLYRLNSWPSYQARGQKDGQ